MQKKFGEVAVFGVSGFGVMVVRPPRRAYAYGALLAVYVAALAEARRRRLAVFFLNYPGEPAGDLPWLDADGIRVLPPRRRVRIPIRALWALRLAWAQLASPGRVARLVRAVHIVKERLLRLALETLTDWQRSLRSKWKVEQKSLKQRRPPPPLQRQIGGWDDMAWPPPGARVSPFREGECKRLARKLGIDLARPLVTLHVREPGWRAGHYAVGDRPVDAVRNADIDTYLPAVRLLGERGFQVVRLGDASMRPAEGDDFLDLAHADGVTPLFELWVVGRSRFMIGSDSGPVGLPALTGTPLLMVNSVHLVWGTRRPVDRFICKLALRRGSAEPMTVAEMLAAGYLTCDAVAAVAGEGGPRYRDNSPDEITAAVEEMVELVERPATVDVPPTEAQLSYRSLLDRALDRRGQQEDEFRRGDGHICDSFARRWLGLPVAEVV